MATDKEGKGMKIQQENLPYRPITIKLETQAEAKAFFEIIDSFSRQYGGMALSENANQLLTIISNGFTERKVRI